MRRTVGFRKFHQVVTEGAFPVNWIIDKERQARDADFL
jgi:hypothetical protein